MIYKNGDILTVNLKLKGKILKWKIIRRNGFLRKKLKSNYCN
jgi:hypothetical protein